MKIFGGSGGRKQTTNQNRVQGEQAPRPVSGTESERTAPKPAGKKSTGMKAAPRPEGKSSSGTKAAPRPAGKSSSGAQMAPRPAGKNSSGAKAAPRPAGKRGGASRKPTKSSKKKRIIIIVAVVLVLLVSIAAAAAVMLIRPPKVESPANKAKRGDDVDINSLLNSGTRIGDVFTFLIGAVDEDETRTDALMVATMDAKNKTLNIMNIPRDTMCNNGASGASRKINAAYGMSKGIEQTKKEVERLMGFVPDNYVIVNFDGIAAIVDAIGGIEYEIPFVMQYDDPSQNLHIDLKPGKQKLNGKQTVEFLRWRHNNDYSMQYPNGDEGRVENQQKFLKALAKEVFQLKNAPNIRKIADAVMKNVKTDFTVGELVWMGMQAINIKNEDIRFFTLPGYGQMSTAGGSTAYSFFFPYYDKTLELVNKYFNPYEEPITTLDMIGGPESYSGGGGHTSSGSDDNYVWGDTSSSNEENEEGSSSETETIDPEGSGSTGEGESSGGSTSGGSTSGGETSGGGSTSGGETSGDSTSGGGDTSGGGTSGGGETSGGGTSGGGETSGGGTSGGGETSGGGTSGGGETSGGSTSGGGGTSGGGSTSGGGDTAVPVDPEA